MPGRRIRCLLCLLVGTLLGCPPPNVATRPAERLPLVVIEINNTPTQSDDYIASGAFRPARIRLLNGSSTGADVPVTLKNIAFQLAPALRFAPSGTPTLTSINLVLPQAGTWVPFTVRPAPGQTSGRDKDAVIEILESRPDGIVLGRKSLAVGLAAPGAAPSVVITIGGTTHLDDYVTWRPVLASVALAAPAASPVNVTLRNMQPATAGRLLFGVTPALDTLVVPPAMSSTLSLALPADGSSVTFEVSGAFGFPSRNDKDAVLEVVRTGTTQVLAREGVMVRIRKNGNTLSPMERQRFVEAVARANLVFGNYPVHQSIHEIADLVVSGALVTSQAHSGPAFLAWHRPFILRLEAELQAIDPGVALPYWRFDQAAPVIFSDSFMGGPPSGGYATFVPGHPLGAWTIEGLSGIFRSPSFAPGSAPSGINSQAATLALGGSSNTYANFATMEGNPHGTAHVRASPFSTGGWIGRVPTAVRDPLFFMLHSNVDRLWAMWQWTYGRKDPAATAAYAPQGAYPNPGSGTIWLGHYARDLMWPWDGRTGFVVPGDSRTRRPATAPGGPLPVLQSPAAALTKPRPSDVVAFDRWTLLGRAGLGYGYDDVPFAP